MSGILKATAMAQGPDREDDGLSKTARSARASQPYLDAVWKFVGGTMVGVLGGYFFDRYLHTSPWGILGFATLGTAVGLIGFIRDMGRLGKKS